MGFANLWLKERALYPEFISEPPDIHTGIIVVVPAYNEPGIVSLLNSLALCQKPDCGVEVIIVVNAPSNASKEYVENNSLTVSNIETWKKENMHCFFRLYSFVAESVIRGWGVGLARKTGMDEAVRRFERINKPEGVIVSLDADCLVEPNYFISIYNNLLKRKEKSACSIYFEHPLSGDKFPGTIYESIALYELHLRYFYQGLVYSCFPFVFHTVGSAIAVKALPYVKAGGMNRKQAGEDFYFIQKLVPAGGYFSLNSTTVYPSPRTSFRVPFGTGASIEKLESEKSSILLTYNFQSFRELRMTFGLIESIYNSNPEGLKSYYDLLPEGIRLFTSENEWTEKVLEIKNNTSELQSFKKRFFGWFNMFRIVKFLNYIHLQYIEKKPIEISAGELLKNIGIECKSMSTVDLLMLYRSMERSPEAFLH